MTDTASFSVYEMKSFVPVKESIEDAEEFVRLFLEQNEVSLKVATKINIVMDEMYSNVVFYSKASECQVKMGLTKEEICLILEDNGSAYNPLEKKDPDINLSAEEREIGGLGIFMSKKIMDTLDYSYEGGHNILEMRKKL